MELNICVNSPGADPAGGAWGGAGEAGDGGAEAGRAAAVLAGSGEKGSEGLASFLASCSNARRNIPVALSGSGCSGPELELLFVMEGGPVPRARWHPTGEHPSWGPWGWGLTAKLTLMPSRRKGPGGLMAAS